MRILVAVAVLLSVAGPVQAQGPVVRPRTEFSRVASPADPDGSGWTTGTWDLSMTCVDATADGREGPPCASTTYTIGASGPVVATAWPVAVHVDSEGRNEAVFFSTDQEGTDELPARSLLLGIDRTPPVASMDDLNVSVRSPSSLPIMVAAASDPAPDGQGSGVVSACFEATDAITGVVVAPCLRGSPGQDGTVRAYATTGTGLFYVRVTPVDRVGHAGAASEPKLVLVVG